MTIATHWLLAASLLGAVGAAAAQAGANPAQKIMPETLLQSLAGRWQGTAKTWFEPGKLADESAVSGSIRPLLGGRFYRHEYQGAMQGKPRQGEETLAYNTVTRQFQISWVDDFHMNYALMFSQGAATVTGFAVTGHYDVDPKSPPWGWRTVHELLDPDHLRITAYNIAPDGQEAKAVETEYQRVKP